MKISKFLYDNFIIIFVTIIIFILYFSNFFRKNSYELFERDIKNLQNDIIIATKQLTEYAKTYVDKRLTYEQNIKNKSEDIKTKRLQSETIVNNILNNSIVANNTSQNVTNKKDLSINAAIVAESEAKIFATQLYLGNSTLKSVEAQNIANDAKNTVETSIIQVKNIYDNALIDSNTINGYLTDANSSSDFVLKTIIDAEKLMTELLSDEKNSTEYINLLDTTNKVKNMSSVLKDRLSISTSTFTKVALQKLTIDSDKVVSDTDNTLVKVDNIFKQASSTGTTKAVEAQNILLVEINNLNKIKNDINNYINKIQEAKNNIEASLIFINNSLISAISSLDSILKIINDKILSTNNYKNDTEQSLIEVQNQFKKLGFPISIKIINFNTGKVSINFNKNYNVNIDGYFKLINTTKNKLISVGPNIADFKSLTNVISGTYEWDIKNNLTSDILTTDTFQIYKNNNPLNLNDNTNLERISDTTIPQIICPFGYKNLNPNSNICIILNSTIIFYSLINYGGISVSLSIPGKNRYYVPFYPNSKCVTNLITSTDIQKNSIGFIPLSVKVGGDPINLIFTGFKNTLKIDCNNSFPIIPPENYSNMNTSIEGVGYNWIVGYNKALRYPNGTNIPGTGTGGYFITIM